MFNKKTWVNRQSEFPTRRKFTAVDSANGVYDVTRNEGNVTTAGDSFSAENMNDLEERIFELPTIYAGTTEPTSGIGKDGDIYIMYSN